MIVAIHGLGDDPENFSHLFDAFPGHARLIALQAPLPSEGGGWSWFPLRARDPDVDALSQGIHDAAASIATSIAILTESRPTAGKPIVTGFSQGGMLSMTLAVEHPELFGRVVAVGGWLPPPLWPTAPRPDAPPILALHGTADTAVRFEPTQASLEHLKRQGWNVRLQAYEGVPHVITPEIHYDWLNALGDEAD